MIPQQPPASSPCLLGDNDPQIDPAYSGLGASDKSNNHASGAGDNATHSKPALFRPGQEHAMQISAGNTIIYCNMWPEMVAYYRDLLGLQPTFVKDEWFIELRVCEGCHLSLAAAERCSVPSAHGKGLTLSWKVSGLTQLHRQLVAKGVEATAITSHSWRAPYFYIHDPEGNRIELWSESV